MIVHRRDFLLSVLAGLTLPLTAGAARLRAGLPGQWRVGDKTGTGENGATNDVAIVWPAPGRPVLIGAYLAESNAPARERNEALADVGSRIAEWIAA